MSGDRRADNMVDSRREGKSCIAAFSKAERGAFMALQGLPRKTVSVGEVGRMVRMVTGVLSCDHLSFKGSTS